MSYAANYKNGSSPEKSGDSPKRQLWRKPAEFLDKVLELTAPDSKTGKRSFRQIFTIGVLLLLYGIAARQFAAPALHRFFIVVMGWKLESSLFWTNLALYGLPAAAGVVLWLHNRSMWGILRKSALWVAACFVFAALYGLLFKFQMVRDMGFFPAYAKWINGLAGLAVPLFILLSVFLYVKGRERPVRFAQGPSKMPVSKESATPKNTVTGATIRRQGGELR